MEVTDTNYTDPTDDLSKSAWFVLEHCFVGNASDFAEKHLREKLLDGEAQVDLDKDASLQEKYGGMSRSRKIKDASFNRNYVIGNMRIDPIREFLIEHLTIGELDRKYVETSIARGEHRTFIDGEEKIWLHDLSGLFITKVVQSFTSGVNHKSVLVDKLNENDLEYNTFGMTGADFAEGMLHEIEDELTEIVEFLKDLR